MASIAIRERQTIARPLKVLIPLIQADIELGDRAGMEYYADAGDKMIEAKDQVAHGRWGSWLSKNFRTAERTARRYMKLARLRADIENGRVAAVLPKSLSEMDGDTTRARSRRKRDREYQSVIQDLETDFYSQEERTRDDEIRLRRELALELVDIGYKALATRLHPDRGGSREAMSRLNAIRDQLKHVAKTRRFA